MVLSTVTGCAKYDLDFATTQYIWAHKNILFLIHFDPTNLLKESECFEVGMNLCQLCESRVYVQDQAFSASFQYLY